MQDSVGKRLTKARIARSLTIDEVAHSTRIRPDKILALESDDYTRFGGNAYAKGFLLIYSKFLKVDASDEARSLEIPKHVPLGDYQYLSGDMPTLEKPSRSSPRLYRPARPSAAPLVVSIILLLGTFLGYYVHITAQRLGTFNSTPTPSSEPAAESTTTANARPDGTAAPTEPKSLPAKPAAPVGDRPATPAVPISANPAVIAGTPIPDSALLNEDGIKVVRAEVLPRPATAPVPPPALPTPIPAVPVGPNAAIAPTAIPPAPTNPASAQVVVPAAGNEFSVGARKKVWVKICRDDPNSSPIFTDYLYPGDGPLKLPRRGVRFYIEAQDPTAIEVRKNGALIAYQPGASIQ